MADQTTIVSLIPYSFTAIFPSTTPGSITIPASELNDYAVTHISRASCKVYIDSERGYMDRPVLSEDIARSVVNDHLGSIFNCSPGVSQPGLFLLEGIKSKGEILVKHKDEYNKYKDLQRNWFIDLVKQADHDWGRTHSPRSINGLQRLAAKFLGYKREWDIDQVIEDIVVCPACNQNTNGAVLCPNCKFIMRPDDYKKLKDNFAKE